MGPFCIQAGHAAPHHAWGCAARQGAEKPPPVNGRRLYSRASAQVFVEEGGHFAEGDDVQVIVQVRMHGAGNEHQLFIAALQGPEGIPAEIARVRLFAVYHQHGASYFACIL